MLRDAHTTLYITAMRISVRLIFSGNVSNIEDRYTLFEDTDDIGHAALFLLPPHGRKPYAMDWQSMVSPTREWLKLV